MQGDERGRRLTGLILESLRTEDEDIEALCRREGVSPEELVGLREAFVCAGAARVHEILRPSAWHQIGVRFDGLGLQLALFLTGRFPDRIRAWLDDGTLDRFFFLNKPPGMRLRFRALRSDFLQELSASLEELGRSGEISGWTLGFYDAEVHQLGGEIGMDIAHEFFTAESLAVLAYRRLQLTAGAALSSPPASACAAPPGTPATSRRAAERPHEGQARTSDDRSGTGASFASTSFAPPPAPCPASAS